MNKWIGMLLAGGLALVCARTGTAATLGVTVDGVDVGAGAGAGWTCDGSNVTVNGSGPFVLSGTSTVARFFVPAGVETHLVLSNLSLNHSGHQFTCPMYLTNGAMAVFTLLGSNYLRSGYGVPAVLVAETATLTLAPESTGILEAQGSNFGAGIGSYAGSRMGTLNIAGGDVRAWGDHHSAIGGCRTGAVINISGGTVYVKGGQFCHGIGDSGSAGGTFGTLNISGGTVMAIGGQRREGLGGQGWKINISGGDVTAVSAGYVNWPSAGIYGELHVTGGTLTATGTETAPDLHSARIDGGSVYLTRGQIGLVPTNTAGDALVELRLNGLAPGLPVAISGSFADYGGNDLFADSLGRVHLWLPAGVYSNTLANGTNYYHVGEAGAQPISVEAPAAEAWPCGWPWIFPVPDQTMHVGDFVSLPLSVVGDPAPELELASSSITATSGYGLDTETQTLTYAPPLVDVGHRTLAVFAGNAVGGMTRTVNVQVCSVPVFSNLPPQAAQTAVTLSFRIHAYAFPLADYVLTETTATTGYAFDAASGTLTYAAPADDVGEVAFTFTASNEFGVATQTVPVAVTASALVGVTVNGEDVSRGAGAGWACAWPQVTFGGAGDFLIAGSNAAARLVFIGAEAQTATIRNLTVSNLMATNQATLNLELEGSNRLAERVQVWGESRLTIAENSTGKLVAWGLYTVNGTDLTIAGGHIDITAGYNWPGIGGPGGTIRITGGLVEVYTYIHTCFAGIGGYFRSTSPLVHISGGTVRSFGNDDIGRAKEGTPNQVLFTGGSIVGTRANSVVPAPTNAAGEAVFPLTLTGLAPSNAVAIEGLPEEYGTNDIETDAAGNVYLWLPAGEYGIFANDFYYPATNYPVTNFAGATVVEPYGGAMFRPNADLVAWAAEPVSFEVSATGDPEPAVTLVETTASSGYLFDAATGILVYTPPWEDLGERTFVFMASNYVCTVMHTVNVQVCSAPVWSNLPPREARTGVPLVCPLHVTAYPPAVCTLTETTATSGYAFDAARGTLTYAPPLDDVGAVAFTFTASNVYGVATQTVSVAVSASDPFGVTVNGEDVSRGAGAGWACAWPEVAIDGTEDFLVSGSNAAARLVFSGTAAQTATIRNLTVGNLVATNHADLTVRLEESNRIARVLGLNDSRLTFAEDSPGSLSVQLGIHIHNNVTLTIAGGRIEALGELWTAAIGGVADSSVCSNSLVKITGGFVWAHTGYGWNPGIGGGHRRTAPVIHVSGGTVRSHGWSDIGKSREGTANQVLFTGGSIVGMCSNSVVPAPTNAAGEAVFPLTLTGLPRSQPVAFEGLPEDYGTHDIETDVAGKVYLWLPAGDYAFYANDAYYVVEDFAAAMELVPTGFRPVFEETPALRLIPGQTGICAVAASGEPVPDVALLAAETTATAGTYAFEAASGALSYVPGVADIGEQTFVFRASNSLAVATQIVSATVLAPVGVTVDGQDAVFGAGPGWTFDGTNIVLHGAARFCLAGAGAEVGVRVPSGTTNAVVASNLTIAVGAAPGLPAVHVESGAATEWSLLGSNRLVSGTACAGMEIAGGAVVVFQDNSTGELSLEGGAGGAGIGFVAGSGGPGQLDVAGGRIAAQGGSGGGAGLGGAGAGRVRISGGRLAARGDAAGGIGLGGLSAAGGSSLDLSGGTVVATAGSGALAVGWTTGAEPSGTLAIRGGSLDAGGGSLAPAPTNAAGQTVHEVVLTGLSPSVAVVLDGLPAEYGMNDVYADADGDVHLWLTPDERVLFANDAIYLVPAGSETRTVAPGGDRPAFAAAPEPFILAGTTGSFQVAVSGADSLELVSTEAEPGTYSFEAASGLATYAPPAGSSGLRTFSFAATNVIGAATQTVWVRIMPAPAEEILIQAVSEPDRYGDFSLVLGPGYAGLAVRLETASEAAGSPPEWLWEPCGQFTVGMDGVLSGVPFANDVQFYRIRSE